MSETKEKTIPTAPDILSSLEKKADSPEKESYDLQIVAPLIGNIFYNLNYTEVRLDEKLKRIYWYDQSYYEIGKHEELYQASILNSRANSLKRNKKLKKWARTFYEEAKRLAPNDNDFTKNLKSEL